MSSPKSKYGYKTPNHLGLTERTIILPEEGLKPSTVYIVEAAFDPYNVIHRTLFYTGFLNGKHNTPGGYNEFLRTENRLYYNNAFFLEFIAPIDMHPDKPDKETKS